MEKAFILISCEIGTEKELAEQIQKIDEIVDVIITYGEYDMVIEAQTDTDEKMDDLITSKIRKLDKIRTTITLRATI